MKDREIDPGDDNSAYREIDRREREIQILINVAEPDPRYQPYGFTDDARLVDAVGTEPEDIQRRLEAYFNSRVAVSLDLRLWEYVDELKKAFPNWPE